MADRFENGDAANDNGGLPPGKGEGQSGFDPTGKGWYHGGDLEGLIAKLDYIKGLGTTAIWLTPSFKNKAVQDNNVPVRPATTATGSPTSRRSTRTWAPTRTCAALVDAAHARGIKVYFDIITNHTADVIQYQEGAVAAVHLQGPVAVPHGVRHAVRRPRLRRRHARSRRCRRPASRRARPAAR